MITFPNAKINLGLNVTGCRANGYHDLETVFLPIDVCDALEFIEAPKTSLTIAGLHIDGDIESNLIVRAFRALQTDFQLPELSISLLKNIPMGAGLGGGSSDAAFMLKMLNEKYQLGISNENLKQYAARLGADCAFFIDNKPAFATGIGEQLSSIEIPLQNWKILLVKPDIHISTAEAYAGVDCKRWNIPLQDAIKMPLSEWKNYIFNDFEEHIFEAHPQLAEIKQKLYDSSAIYASMSGSGSTIYGIYEPNFNECELPKFCDMYHAVRTLKF